MKGYYLLPQSYLYRHRILMITVITVDGTYQLCDQVIIQCKRYLTLLLTIDLNQNKRGVFKCILEERLWIKSI